MKNVSRLQSESSCPAPANLSSAMPEATTSAAILSADGVWLTDLARAKFAHQPLLSSLILRVLMCGDQKDRSGDGRIARHPNIDCADDSFGIGTTVFLNTSTVAPLSPLSCPARLAPPRRCCCTFPPGTTMGAGAQGGAAAACIRIRLHRCATVAATVAAPSARRRPTAHPHPGHPL